MKRLAFKTFFLTAIILLGCRNPPADSTSKTSNADVVHKEEKTSLEKQHTHRAESPLEKERPPSKKFSESSYTFSKELGQKGHYEGLSFKVWTERKHSTTVVHTQPSGYKKVNDVSSFSIKGKVYDAEIDDVDNDRYPEVLIYTVDEDDIRNVRGYSSNFDQSMSFFYCTPTRENNRINEGYMGGDEFTVIEGKLAHRFPLFKNNVPTGKTRQVLYDLVPAEASKRFEINRIFEYP